MTDEEVRAAAREFVRRTTAAQGIPYHVEDPVVLAKIATLIRPTLARKR